MAQKLNKLGQVLVYDSDVKLLDKTPGGNGFQSVTLDAMGVFTNSGTDATYVKGNGTPEENGQALLDSYASAKQAAIDSGREHFLVIAPGRYDLPENWILDGRVSVLSADGKASVIIRNNQIRYTYNGYFDFQTISGLNTFEWNVPIYFEHYTTRTQWDNIYGGHDTFNTDTPDATISQHTFRNCFGKSRSFFGKTVSSDIDSKNYNYLSGCYFINCESTNNHTFATNAKGVYNCYFIDCIARSPSNFATGTKLCERSLFKNCYSKGGTGFLSSLPSTVTLNWNNIIDCYSGGSGSFGSYCDAINHITFINCNSEGNQSFLYSSQGGSYNHLVLHNCTGTADDCFGDWEETTPTLQATCINCYAGTSFGFQGGDNISMKLINCQKEAGSFISVGTGGKVVNCINNATVNPTLVNIS